MIACDGMSSGKLWICAALKCMPQNQTGWEGGVQLLATEIEYQSTCWLTYMKRNLHTALLIHHL